jgi:alginate O-acetyltransferase complex protein AlgJ
MLGLLLLPAFALCAPADAYLADLQAKSAAMEKAEAFVAAGKDGWLFFGPELRAVSVGRFWGADAAKVSRAKTDADPLPAILDLKAQLDKAGVELLMVPVPAKATIYPEAISDTVAPATDAAPPRLDVYHQEFFALLRDNGIPVLDLTDEFLAHRADAEGALYCRQDSHWSGRAVQFAAQRIAARLAGRPWLADVPKRTYDLKPRTIGMTGDLWTLLGDTKLPKERMALTEVWERAPAGPAAVQTWRESPVLLLGDSHNLVFQAGADMHATNAGLPDHLAAQLGFPVDLVAVRGSGATPARINLMRRRDNLAGKKLLIWCFSVREFTESQGWRKVPLVK